MQKFIKETTKKKLVIPNAVLELCGLEKGEPVEIRVADDAVIILRKKMTAMQLLRAVDSLQRLAEELNQHLAQVCDPCEDCSEDGECPALPEKRKPFCRRSCGRRPASRTGPNSAPGRERSRGRW